MLRKITWLWPIASAFLLIIAYPQIEWAPLAWVALVPLFFTIDGQRPWVAFRRAYLCGFIFFAGTLGWLVYVTYPGAFLMVAFLSLYFAIFGAAFVYFQRLPLIARLLTLSAAWTALEFTRAHLFTGFGWAALGHSQYKNILLIQIADITGMYGVSFLVMLVNLLVFESFRNNGRQIYWAQAMVIAFLLAAVGYGTFTMTRPHAWPMVKVGVVQPNIPQSIKWEPELQPSIVDKTIRLSHTLIKQKPEIIIWPETSLPGVISEVPDLNEAIKATAAETETVILYGAIVHDGDKYYNSALLASADGKSAGRYDKMHLVPFGEFLPLRPILGWINHFVALEDFTSGQQYTILPAGCPQKRFGTLICFEDTLDYMRRNSAKAGAMFFVNITNDAWFEDTKAPFLHLQGAVFGAVENKRAMVRSANTGVSAFIDPYGRIIETVHNEAGKKTFITGTAIASLPLVSKLTFYTKRGDVFTFLCFLGILGALAYTRKRKTHV